jgi:hypothetical protein
MRHYIIQRWIDDSGQTPSGWGVWDRQSACYVDVWQFKADAQAHADRLEASESGHICEAWIRPRGMGASVSTRCQRRRVPGTVYCHRHAKRM